MKDEKKLDEMVHVLEHLHQYVPTVSREEKADVPGTEQQVTLQVHDFHQVLLGEDQLTVARIRGAQRIRVSSESASARLQGFIPVVEDWNAKQCLMGISTYVTNITEQFSTVILYISSGDLESITAEGLKPGSRHSHTTQELSEPN